MAADRIGVPSELPDRPMLAVDAVSKMFGGVRAVENVTVSIRRGEIMSVIGPNGAGKTSLLNMISGFYRPTSGSIVLEGRDITHARPSQIAALGVARTFQNIALFAGMTVLDNIMLGRHVHMRAGVLACWRAGVIRVLGVGAKGRAAASRTRRAADRIPRVADHSQAAIGCIAVRAAQARRAWACAGVGT